MLIMSRIYKISIIEKERRSSITKKPSWECSSSDLKEICCRCGRLLGYASKKGLECGDSWGKKGKKNPFLKINLIVQLISAIQVRYKLKIVIK